MCVQGGREWEHKHLYYNLAAARYGRKRGLALIPGTIVYYYVSRVYVFNGINWFEYKLLNKVWIGDTKNKKLISYLLIIFVCLFWILAGILNQQYHGNFNFPTSGHFYMFFFGVGILVIWFLCIASNYTYNR